MMEYWENKFGEIQTNWGFEPAETAIQAKELFAKNKVKSVLLPGIGYGRNAKIFLDAGMEVTGIELSATAIRLAKEKNGLDINIYHGSVTEMPYDNKKYDAVFCYALVHLLNKNERQQFIKNCFNQLKIGGYMIFSVASTTNNMFGQGKQMSRNRFEIEKGMKVFFYDYKSVKGEFKNYGLKKFKEINEPIKNMENIEPVKLIYIECRKEGMPAPNKV